MREVAETLRTNGVPIIDGTVRLIEKDDGSFLITTTFNISYRWLRSLSSIRVARSFVMRVQWCFPRSRPFGRALRGTTPKRRSLRAIRVATASIVDSKCWCVESM